MEEQITKGRSREMLLKEIKELRSSLRESEQTLEAIRTGDVDALVVKGPFGEQVFSLTGSERIYRTIVETMNEAALTISAEGTILYCNMRFSDLLKMPMDKVIGRKLIDFVETSLQASLLELVEQTQKKLSRKRLLLKSADGHDTPAQFSGSLLVAENGPCTCLVVTDLTQVEARTDHIRFLEEYQEALKASQKETQESERKFRGLFENSTNAVLFTIPGGPVIAANPAACALLGWTEEELCGMDSSAIMDTSDPRVSEAVEECRRTGFIRGWELTAIRKDGKRIPIEVDSAIIPGEPTRAFAMWRDITERKQAEEELAAAHRLIQNIIDRTPDLVYAFDLDGRFVMANAATAALLSTTPEQMIGKKRHEFMPKKDADRHESHDRKVIESGRMLEFEEYNDLESRSITWLTKKFPLRDAQGNLFGIAGISADISDRKRAEEELRRLNETLENKVMERTSALQAANLVLEQRASQLRELAGKLTTAEHRERQRLAKILHDGLQQYLVAVKLQLNGLASSQEGNPVRESLYELDNLLNDAVQVSRNLAVELSPPILQDAGIVPALEWLSRWNHQKYGLKVKVVRDMEAPLLSDEIKVLVFESVRELLLNVVKHSGAKEAEIRLCQTIENKLQVTVSDSGTGYDAGRMTAWGMPDSGGLGLFSIRERIQIIGGEFKADSTPDRGSRFVLTVPMTIIVSQKVVQPDQSQCTPIASAAQNRKIRILLTDDHAVMREGLARLLSQESDMEIVGQAADGQEAVEMAERLQPDVVLMDLSMPRLNGTDATRIIHRKHPDIRIVGLSLYTEEERSREMIEAGAASYLSKEGAPSELKAAIRTFGMKPQSQIKPLSAR